MIVCRLKVSTVAVIHTVSKVSSPSAVFHTAYGIQATVLHTAPFVGSTILHMVLGDISCQYGIKVKLYITWYIPNDTPNSSSISSLYYLQYFNFQDIRFIRQYISTIYFDTKLTFVSILVSLLTIQCHHITLLSDAGINWS